MSLLEHTLFGVRDKVQTAIERLKQFEPATGYWLAFSGGKDSISIYHLAKMAGVKFTAHFNVTTVDAPELLRFVKVNYPDVQWHYPALTMWQLIRKKMMPPTRLVRYCCEHLKERSGEGVIITGVRWAESSKRAMRKMFEPCFKNKRKFYLNPIIDWNDSDVWEFIKGNNLPYPSLYDEGFTRIGCIGCPIAGQHRNAEFQRWPHFKKMYMRAFDRCVEARTASGKTEHDKYAEAWTSGQAMFDWWMQDKHPGSDENQQCFLLE